MAEIVGAESGGGGGASVASNVHADTAAGDVLVAVQAAEWGSLDQMQPTAGDWVPIADWSHDDSPTTDGLHVRLWGIEADGEETSFAFAQNSAADGTLSIVTLRDVTLADLIAAGVFVVSTTETNRDAPGLLDVPGGSVLLCGATMGEDATWTAPAGMDEVTAILPSAFISTMVAGQLDVSGDTSPRRFTAGNLTEGDSITWSLALPPPGVGGGDAPQPVGTAVTNFGQTNSITANAPDGVLVGDHQVVFAVAATTGETVNADPSGWLLAGTLTMTSTLGTNDTTRLLVYTSDPDNDPGSAPFAVGKSGNRLWAAIRFAYRGGPGPTGLVIQIRAAGAQSFALPQQSPAVAGSVVVGGIVLDESGPTSATATLTQPAGWVELGEVTNLTSSGTIEALTLGAAAVVAGTPGNVNGTYGSSITQDAMVWSLVMGAAGQTPGDEFTGAGSTPLALDITGTGTKTAGGTAAAVLALATTGTGTADRSATGTAGLTLTTAATGTATRSTAGEVGVALDVVGSGTAARAGAGDAAVDLAAVGTGAKTATGHGAVRLTLDVAGVGRPTRSGTVALALDAAGTGTADRAGTGTAELVVAAAGTGAKTATGHGTVGLALDATGTADPEVRGRGTAGVQLAAAGTGTRYSSGHGSVTLALAAGGTGSSTRSGTGTVGLGLAAAGRKTTGGGTGRTGLVLAAAGAGVKTATGHGTVGLALGTSGAGRAERSGAGTTGLVVDVDRAAEHRTAEGAGSAALAVAAAGMGHRAGVGSAAVLVVLSATGAGGAVERRGTGRVGLALRAGGGARRVVSGRGTVGLLLVAGPRRRIPGRNTATAGRSGLVTTGTASRLEATA